MHQHIEHLLVQVLESQECLVDEADGLAGLELPAALEHVFERLALNVLHDQVVELLGAACLLGLANLEGADFQNTKGLGPLRAS